jgi:uncharacterized protein YciI
VRIFIKRLLLVCVCAIPALLTAQTEMSQYYVGIIYKGETWKPYTAPGAPELQEAHLANIQRLEAEGKMLMAGPFADDTTMRGLFFYKAASIEEAQELVDTDPAVIAGQLRVELHPWWGPTALEQLP